MIIGEMNIAVSALPPKASIRAMYGVPRNAPMLTPDSAMEVAEELILLIHALAKRTYAGWDDPS